MAALEQFSLRWNNFHSNISTGFHELFEASDMVDVTIAIDGQYLQAHKIVLSICSPYFKEIFKINPCKHPIVILKDISHNNMKDILHFMYLGEVNVLRDNLPSFLRTAELLQVKGLTGEDSNETPSKKEDNMEIICDNVDEEQDCNTYDDIYEQDQSVTTHRINNTKPNSSNKRSIKAEPQSAKKSKSDFNSNQTTSIKSESTTTNNISNNVKEEVIENNTEYDSSSYLQDSGNIEAPYQNIKNTLEQSRQLLNATENNIQDHGKSKITHPFKCEKCMKRFSRRDHLRTHERNIHGEDAGPFACVMCSQLYKNSESLRKHIAKFHFQKSSENQKEQGNS